MPRPKSLKKTVKCLVCAGSTDSANLGVDVCKACTVFYRRSRNRKYVCRSGTDRCPIGDGLNCRKCRMRELERKLEGKAISELNTSTKKGTENVVNDSQGALLSASSVSSGSCEQSPGAGALSTQELLKHGYRSMCNARLIGELNTRVSPIHPMDAIEGKYEILPGTFRSIDAANRIFLTSLLQFGSVAFPGFDALAREEKWTIVTNFFRRFRAFDAGYRALKAFGDQTDRTFAGFTVYFDGNMPANFFEGCPVSDAKEAKRIMEDKFNGDFRTGRVHLNTANLRHEEFLAVLALMFWTTDGLPISESTAQFGKNCRDSVLKELHGYYKNDLRMDDYAARLGELLMLLQIFEQRSACTLEHFEVLRLLNVFTDDSFSYMLMKDGDA